MLLSKSGLNLYLRCPYAFKLNYIDKIKITKTSRRYEKGTILHEYFDMFFNHYQIKDGVVIPTFSVKQEYLQDFLVFLYHENNRYQQLTTMGRLDIFEPYLREKYLIRKDIGIHGIIDRVDKDVDGAGILIEYKTGNINVKSITRELAFYHLLLENYINIKQWKVLATKSQRIYIYDTNDNIDVIKDVKNVITRVRQRIKNHVFPYNKSTDTCFYCEFKAYCNVWGG